MSGKLTLKSTFLKVLILPQVGGKIGQINDASGRISLLVPAQRRFRQIPPSANWIDYDMSGMDDCFPNIAGGLYPYPPWKGMALPDLGEWVHGGWNLTETSEKGATLAREGALLPYSAKKVVCFSDPQTLDIHYSVKNLSEFPIRYLWAAHPLVAVGAKFEIKLPVGRKLFRLFPEEGKDYVWPLLGTVDLSRQWISKGRTLKVFIIGLSEGWCELSSLQFKIRMTFDLKATPFLGLWYNNFGFPKNAMPFRCIAIEPCTSPSDLIGKQNQQDVPTIPPQSSKHWWLRIGIRLIVSR